MKAVFLDRTSIYPQDLDLSPLIEANSEWIWLDNTKNDEALFAIADAEIVVTNKVLLPADVIAQARNLGLICIAATGVNNVAVDTATECGVTVCNVRAYATPSVVQHVFTLLLSLMTNFQKYQADVVNGEWSKSDFFCLLDYPVRELQGMTLGIVGYGELGQAIAKVAQCFGMQVLVAKRNKTDQREGRIDLYELLPQVDVLSLHCPLTESNRNLIGKGELSLMKEGAILINTARGGLVDEAALVNALNRGLLGGAALDVLAEEPPPEHYPTIVNKPQNLIITPHTAWTSQQSRQRLVNEVAKNIEAFIRGMPRNQVF